MWSGTYLPFGQEWNPQPTTNHYKFTGKERDSESGLDNFGARYDSSQYGRFMTHDPGEFSGFEHKDDPQSWNGYAYARNNPLLYTDPDGDSYQVCVPDDQDQSKQKCTTVSDEQFSNIQRDPGSGISLRNGDIYATDANGTQSRVGSYVQTDVDLPPGVADMLHQAGVTSQAGLNLSMAVTAPNYLLMGGANLLLSGSSTTLGNLTVLSNQAAGRIIGWGVGQTAVAVEATRRLAETLTPADVEAMAAKGLNLSTVQNLINQYGSALAEGGAKLSNTQLQPRYELMKKIMELWPNK